MFYIEAMLSVIKTMLLGSLIVFLEVFVFAICIAGLFMSIPFLSVVLLYIGYAVLLATTIVFIVKAVMDTIRIYKNNYSAK